MSYIPANSEIHLYIREAGTVFCDMGCIDWTPARVDPTHPRRITLDDLVAIVRQHVVEVHTND